jgi:hypothetical protein
MPVEIGVQTLIYPDDIASQRDFRDPIQIRWPGEAGSLFHLCVGTEPGNWNILSIEVRKRRYLLDLSDAPGDPQVVYVQLVIFTDDGDGKVGPTIEIRRQ